MISKSQEETEVPLHLEEKSLEAKLRLSWGTACDRCLRPKQQQLGQTSICGKRARARSTKYELGLSGQPRCGEEGPANRFHSNAFRRQGAGIIGIPAPYHHG